MKDISFKAMLAGATAGISITFMLGVLQVVVAQTAFRLAGESPVSFNERMHEWPLYLLIGLGLGSVGDVFAGFIGALVARAAATKNGVVAAVFAVVLSLPMLPTVIERNPLWFTLTSFLLVVPGAVLGARVAAWLAPKNTTTAQ